MKITFVTTVLNEEKNIKYLLSSLLNQSRKPDEVIIVDGGSKDATVRIIKGFISNIRSENFKKRFKLIVKKGNRSVGRNEGISKSQNEIVVLSDSGCVLDRNWVENIEKPFRNKDTEVVAGYSKGLPLSSFMKSLVPYVLVMPDRVDPKSFLPSGRSMAIRKSTWKKNGGFPIEYSNNEDYVFANRLKKRGIKIVFRKNAVVYWIPRKNIVEAFSMFLKFAFGDSQAGILRSKVILILLRYILLIWILIFSLYLSVSFMLEVVLYILLAYTLWSVWKNYKYIRQPEGFVFLPLLQITSDFAVILGTLGGICKSLWDTQKKR